SDQKRNMLRRVSRSMEDRDQDMSELEGVAVSHTAEWKFHLRISEQHVLCAGGGCEDATRRNVISMNVSIDNIANAHPRGFSGSEIGRDLPHRIDHGCRGTPSAAEEVGCRDRLGVEELAKDHGTSPGAAVKGSQRQNNGLTNR